MGQWIGRRFEVMKLWMGLGSEEIGISSVDGGHDRHDAYTGRTNASSVVSRLGPAAHASLDVKTRAAMHTPWNFSGSHTSLCLTISSFPFHDSDKRIFTVRPTVRNLHLTSTQHIIHR